MPDTATIQSLSTAGALPPDAGGETKVSVSLSLLVLLAYLIVTLAFHAIGNPFLYLYGAGDGFTAGLPSKIFSTTLSAWNPYVQLGQPAFANTQFQSFYPPGLIIMGVLPITIGYNIFILLHFVIAGYFFYLFGRGIRLSHYAAFIGGLCFLLSGFLAAHKGHQSMLTTAVWLPLMLYFVDRYVCSSRLSDLASCSIAVACSILAGFAQITLYSMLVVVAYAGYRFAAKEGVTAVRKAKDWLIAVSLVVAVSTLLSALQLLAVAEALPHMTRQKLTYAMFCEDFFPLYQVFAFVFPNMFGGLYGAPNYASNINFVEIYAYMGLLPLSVAIAAFRYHRGVRKDVFFWGVVGLVALVVSLGAATPLYRLLYFVPVYNLFRAPARHLFEIHFAISALVALACQSIFAEGAGSPRQVRKFVKQVAWTMTVVFAAGFAATQVLSLGMVALNSPKLKALDDLPVNQLVTIGQIKAAALENLRTDHSTILLPFVFFVLSLAVLAAFALAGRTWWIKVALPIVIAADLICVHRVIYKYPNTAPLYDSRTREEVAYLQRNCDPGSCRVYPVEHELVYAYPLLNMMYGLSAVNDYTPMWLKRYQSITGFQLNGAAPLKTITNAKLMSVISAKYLVTGNASIREGIKTATALEAGQEGVAIAAGFEKWQAAGATMAPGGGLVLRSPDGSGVSLAQLPVPLKPNATYVVQFQVRASRQPSHGMVIDLYGGANYDSAAQDRGLHGIAQDFRNETITIGSGPAPPPEGFVRMYTQSEEAIEIRAVKVSVLDTVAPKPSFEEILKTRDGLSVFLNPAALPRFRFAREILPARDAGDAHAKVLDPAFDPAAQAVVEGIPARLTVAPGEITAQNVENSRMNWRVRTGERSFFVVADSWFPGWTAYVDGVETRIYPVDGFLRGILIEGAGQHNVEMRYRPASLYYGSALTLIGLALVALAYAANYTRLPATLERFRHFGRSSATL